MFPPKFQRNKGNCKTVSPQSIWDSFRALSSVWLKQILIKNSLQIWVFVNMRKNTCSLLCKGSRNCLNSISYTTDTDRTSRLRSQNGWGWNAADMENYEVLLKSLRKHWIFVRKSKRSNEQNILTIAKCLQCPSIARENCDNHVIYEVYKVKVIECRLVCWLKMKHLAKFVGWLLLVLAIPMEMANESYIREWWLTRYPFPQLTMNVALKKIRVRF